MCSVNGAPQGSTYRELKSVLFADVAGYARLTESNEELTHHNLCVRFSQISSLIHHYDGLIHRTEGDSVLATFTSATNALQCAVDIQASSLEQNKSLKEEDSINFKIGINCGEVLIDSGEAFGNCVNIAKRLESNSNPGNIVFSETFFSHVHQTLPYKYEYLGKRALKNINHPIKIYSISLQHKPVLPDLKTILSNGTRRYLLPLSTAAVTALVLFFTNDISYFAPENNFGSANSVRYINSSSEANFNDYAQQDNERYTRNKVSNNLLRIASYDQSLKEPESSETLYKQLTHKNNTQNALLHNLENQNRSLLKNHEEMREKFAYLEKEITSKDSLLDKQLTKNRNLVEANKLLLKRLDNVVSKQSLRTYENLYAEYNPVRQQIIDIIESKPEKKDEVENSIRCSIYTNENAKPQALSMTKGATREELQCIEPNSNHMAAIPQSKLADPIIYKKTLAPKEKKVVIYASVPKLPHQTSQYMKHISDNIVKLYKDALSGSALQTYKTNYVVLTPPQNTNNLSSLDTEHCNVYKADYVASFRVNTSQTNSTWPITSALVIHNCGNNTIAEKDTRHLLSDSWKNDGELYLTSDTLNSFNSQVSSIVELALARTTSTELEL